MATSVIKYDEKVGSTNEVIIANFLNGKLSQQASQKNQAIQVACFKSKDGARRKRKYTVAETSTMTYTGHSTSSQNTIIKYLVGVRDKKSGTMKIMDAQIYNMKPSFPGDTNEFEEDEVDAVKDMSFIEKNDLLTGAFGSSKKQRIMNSRLNNAIKGEALQKAVSATVHHAMSRPHSFLPTATEVPNEMSILPPCNKDATRPQDVYRLEDIISEAELGALGGVSQEIIAASKKELDEWNKQERYPSYVIQHLYTLPIQEESRLKKANILLYMSYLIATFQLKAADLKQKDLFTFELPDMIKRKLLKTYTIKSTDIKPIRCIPARLKDKLAASILTLALIIDEFSVNLSQLQKDLKMGQQKITTLMRSLGCKITSQKSGITYTKQAELTCPLTFPDFAPRKAKGGRK